MQHNMKLKFFLIYLYTHHAQNEDQAYAQTENYGTLAVLNRIKAQNKEHTSHDHTLTC